MTPNKFFKIAGLISSSLKLLPHANMKQVKHRRGELKS
jgi:hypothetical protein